MPQFGRILKSLLLIFSVLFSSILSACPSSGKEWESWREKLIGDLQLGMGSPRIEALYHELGKCRDFVKKNSDRSTKAATACTEGLYDFLDFLVRRSNGVAGPFFPDYRERADVRLATRIPDELLAPEFLNALLNAQFENLYTIEDLERHVEEINQRSKKRFHITMVPNLAQQAPSDRTGMHRIAFLVSYSEIKLTQFIQATIKDQTTQNAVPTQLSIIAVQKGKAYFNDYNREGHKVVFRQGRKTENAGKYSSEESCLFCHTSGPIPLKPLDGTRREDLSAQALLSQRHYVENLNLFNKAVRESYTRTSLYINDRIDAIPLIGSPTSVKMMNESDLVACSGLSAKKLGRYGNRFINGLNCTKCHDGRDQPIIGYSSTDNFVDFRMNMPPGWLGARKVVDPEGLMDREAVREWRRDYHGALRRCVEAAHLKELKEKWTQVKCSRPLDGVLF